ncbi:type II secretion system protein [Kiritimatiella glycovorans]|uniref:Putative major pilin subunit n=1 Tax=Kiritimatiella glycovorans TaxID=1307763 RepID=A0A0G3EFR2_9BACT|nr:type II secretion system protein [Kiritimatiella glycovorans]AKJ63640.1 putative major pilin subunit [Kiritimatiella glycovorans]
MMMRHGIEEHSRSGFTLVELLVVIAILAVLMMILVPAIQKGLEQAQMTRCQSHLRTIGVAVMEHVSDHKNRLPWLGDFGWDQGSWNVDRFWRNQLVDGGYLEDYDVLQCPGEKHHHGMGDLGPNRYIIPHSRIPPTLASIRRPRETVLCGDTRQFANGRWQGSWWMQADNFVDNHEHKTGVPWPPRHGEFMNFLFFDGSVRALKQDYLKENDNLLFHGEEE